MIQELPFCVYIQRQVNPYPEVLSVFPYSLQHYSQWAGCAHMNPTSTEEEPHNQVGGMTHSSNTSEPLPLRNPVIIQCVHKQVGQHFPW